MSAEACSQDYGQNGRHRQQLNGETRPIQSTVSTPSIPVGAGRTIDRHTSIQHEAFLADEADTGVDRSRVVERSPVLHEFREGCLNAQCRTIWTVR